MQYTYFYWYGTQLAKVGFHIWSNRFEIYFYYEYQPIWVTFIEEISYWNQNCGNFPTWIISVNNKLP